MKRSTFLKAGMYGLAGLTGIKTSLARPQKNSISLLRHATLVIELGGVKFLVDPMLSPKAAMDPVANAGNQMRIPMVDLPVSIEGMKKIIADADAIVVTHTHRDHWDKVSQEMIPKDKLIICQPADDEAIRNQKFTNVTSVIEKFSFKGIDIWRTDGHHGTGDIEKKMGTVSGFIFSKDKQTIYVAGDTIACIEVEQALKKYRPGTVVLNAGAAQFLSGGPITMSAEDVIKTRHSYPDARYIAVHMDTINHCLLTRSLLQAALTKENLTDKILIPDDGEVIVIS